MKRAAVIGLGDISSVHLNAIAENPNVELEAVCDVNSALAARASGGVPFFTDYREMIGAVRPDAVHLCLPHYLHAPVSISAASMGVNVLCEKPVALNAVEAREFAAFEAAHPEVHIGIVLQNRFNRTVRTLKGIIDSGEYGAVTGARGMVAWARKKSYYDAKPWRGTWAQAGGGCMINQAVHTLDLLDYLTGGIRSVRALVGRICDYDLEVEDTAAARLDFQNGASGLFFATVANDCNEEVQLFVRLERAEFRIYGSRMYRVLEGGALELLCEDGRMAGEKFYYGTSHSALIAQFYQSLEDGSQDYIHVRDAVMSIRLIDAIQRSGRTGESVDLAEI